MESIARRAAMRSDVARALVDGEWYRRMSGSGVVEDRAASLHRPVAVLDPAPRFARGQLFAGELAARRALGPHAVLRRQAAAFANQGHVVQVASAGANAGSQLLTFGAR